MQKAEKVLFSLQWKEATPELLEALGKKNICTGGGQESARSILIIYVARVALPRDSVILSGLIVLDINRSWMSRFQKINT